MTTEQSPTFRELLQRRAASSFLGSSEDVWKYREAASVLASFDYNKLKPRGDVSSETAKTELLADCDAMRAPNGATLWSLRRPIRQAALRRLLRTESVDVALNCNPDRPRTETQQLLEHLLSGNTVSPSGAMSAEQGRALLEVVDWLSGIPELKDRLPSVDEVKRRQAWTQLLQPFRDLVGTTFAGRKEEIEQLSDYVGYFDAHVFAESAARFVEDVFSIKNRPPLFINGPGGAGKSTLIARFILDHAEVDNSERFPFAYLDFDRRGLLAEEPITLLTEIMRQLAIEFPDAANRFAAICDEWAGRVAQQVELPAETDEVLARPTFRLADRESFLSDFAVFVNDLKTTSQPLLLVLDTFEEVQFRSAAFADEVYDFLDALQQRVPRLRTVLSGRAEIRSSRYKVRKISIENFDKEAAVAVLMNEGIDDAQVAQRIYDQVGGSPLVLRLAADVSKIEKVGQSGIKDLPSSFWSLFNSQSIEVVLYKRILSHIYDKRVEQLAYPGLVLRVITPAVLQKVLAGPCGVPVATADEAKELVTLMRERLSTILVSSTVDADTLVHRGDMRNILLQDVEQKKKKDVDLAAKINVIHQEAIKYYSGMSGVAARAEEIYHRLALDVDRAALAPLMAEPGLVTYLGSSIRELPQASQLYLAARLGVELPEEMWKKADDDDWLPYVIRAAHQQMDVDKPLKALDLLAERPQLYGTEPVRDTVNQVAFAVFHQYAREYEHIRRTQKPSDKRTGTMDALVTTVAKLQRKLPQDASYPIALFIEDGPGSRVVALALAYAMPNAQHMDLATEAIRHARSPFEQYHALLLARRTFDLATPAQLLALWEALRKQEGVKIDPEDRSRWVLSQELLKRLQKLQGQLT